MKKTALAVALVLGLVPVAAQATITYTISYLGGYTLGLGSGPTIDVFKFSMDAGEGRVLGALVLDIGTTAGYGGDDPFQAAWVTGGWPGPIVNLTPTQDDADYWLTPPDTSKCYEADTHFLPAGIGTWAPVVVVPDETNDGSIYNAGNNPNDYKAGVGYLSIATGIPVACRTRTLDVAQVGVIRGEWVYFKSGSVDDLGNVTHENIFFPEPATALLVVAGAIGLLRRRRA
jgi:hypothetical protein